MEVTKPDMEQLKYKNLDRLMEQYFSMPFNSIQESLYAWFLFALSNRGSDFTKLSKVDFKTFNDQLFRLIDELYQVCASDQNSVVDRKEDIQ
jgi:hypothetical protein